MLLLLLIGHNETFNTWLGHPHRITQFAEKRCASVFRLVYSTNRVRFNSATNWGKRTAAPSCCCSVARSYPLRGASAVPIRGCEKVTRVFRIYTCHPCAEEGDFHAKSSR